MNFKRFDLKIILAVIIISTTNFLFFWALTQPQLKLSIFYIVLLQIAEIIWLIYYIRRNNNAILDLLTSVKHNDALIKLRNNEDEMSFKAIRKVLSEIADSYQEIKINKESNYQYFQRILSDIGIGVITFNEEEKIDFINSAALEIFKIDHLTNLQELNKFKKGFSELLVKLPHNNQSLIQLKIENLLNEIVIKATEFKITNRKIKLISLQNINSELESRESVAWNKLIRVLNHEIMNSIGPITSLSSSLIERYRGLSTEDENKEIDQKLKNSTLLALIAIERRSNGLFKFIKSYRDLAKFREINFSIFSIREIFERIEMLDLFKNYDIDFSFETDIEESDLSLTADERYLEQMLINLIKNACEAAPNDEKLEIKLSASRSPKGNIQIQLSDNGIGIPDEDLENIFTPFYSTKDNGSGIGLSLCRQIMQLHAGTIRVQSKKGEGSTFTLEF